MTRWQSVLLGVLFLSIAAALFARGWMDREDRQQHAARLEHWVAVEGTVTGHKTVQVFKGEGTSVLGTYGAGGKRFPFEFYMGRNTRQGTASIPPPSVPPIGGSLRIYYNQASPDEATIAALPTEPFFSGRILLLMGVLLGLGLFFLLHRR